MAGQNPARRDAQPRPGQRFRVTFLSLSPALPTTTELVAGGAAAAAAGFHGIPGLPAEPGAGVGGRNKKKNNKLNHVSR